MLGAPNRMKQPSTIITPRRAGSLPPSSESPSPATAITAIAVLNGPNNRSATHCTAASGWLGPDNVDTAKSEFMIGQLHPLGTGMQPG